jgi:ribosomal protein S18 acetylase RimI-like enzyme
VLTSVPVSDRQQAISTIASAFIEDPVERWLYPDRKQYLTHFPRFVGALGGRAFDVETAWRLGEHPAVAFWLPPDTEPDGEAVASVLTETVSADKHEEMFSVLEQMDNGHPTFAHWYLPWLAVEPGSQGEGLGAKLLEKCLTLVDESGLPAFLETPNPRNIAFYQRHGFEVTTQAQAGSCPPVTLMLRAAQT